MEKKFWSLHGVLHTHSFKNFISGFEMACRDVKPNLKTLKRFKNPPVGQILNNFPG